MLRLETIFSNLLSFEFVLSTFLLLLTVIYLLYRYSISNFDYWEKRKVFYVKPVPFFGNFLDLALFRKTIGEHLANLYNKTKEPFFGIFIFGRPCVVIRSPELIKAILVRDFQNFDDRSIASCPHDPIISNILFIQKNPEWKMVRTKMTPVYTTGKLKSMVPLINMVAENMKAYVTSKIPHISVDAKEICLKYSTDVIARCAFGINAHSLDSDADGEFRKVGRRIFDFRYKTAFRQTSYFFCPFLVDLLHLRFIDEDNVEFLKNVLNDTITRREKTGEKVNDVIDTVIEMKKSLHNNKDFKFDADKIVAQAVQFFIAGFETTGSTMAHTLYELCIHPEIQQKVRTDIQNGLQESGDKITYETVQNMKYLHMCVSETLRKYPVLPFLDRRCRNDYKMPDSDVVIEKGTPVYIPMFGLHYDEEYFPDPQKYDPERFSEENIHNIVPFSYIPFGEGPRNCIGARFGAMGAKLGLVHILSEFELERSTDTPVPIIFEAKSFVLQSKVGLPVKFKKITTKAA